MPNKITLIPEIKDAIIELGGEDTYKCYQCGKCMSVCPWSRVPSIAFPTYRIPQAVKLGIVASSEDTKELAKEIEEVFRCCACEGCLKECPHGVNLPIVFRAIRRILVDYGSYPEELKGVVSRLFSTGNPLGESKDKRADWASELPVQKFTSDMDFLYFSCCMPAYDQRAQGMAVATAKILLKARVSFGILGELEVCCGESVRKIGAEKVFKELASTNIKTFKDAGVKKVITTSPHCYSTFKHEYPELGAEFEVIHETQLFAKLIKNKKIIPNKIVNAKVVYHDPCNLGRQNEIYEAPREVLKSIPGIELFEIPNFSHKYSLCCGGGGSGIFIGWDMEERIANVRVQQVFDVFKTQCSSLVDKHKTQVSSDKSTSDDSTNPEFILAVACPYCLQMFEDSVKVLNLPIQVKSISELLAESLYK